ncbi:glycosyltransferase [Candidatus Uhrbacteria bacterium]|nr:glycosyltransferase [Candidatus Uhrbacteria bacterium]
MKLALVHDYLIQDGGAERVLRAFSQIWPNAPIFVLFYDKKRWGREFKERDMHTSVLQGLPGVLRYYRWTLPLMPAATEHHDLGEFDAVLSSSSAFAKGVVTRPDALHISYCHTPTRYLWTETHSYIKDLRTNRAIKFALPFLLTSLRMWDRTSALRVDRFLANSQTVAKRIKKYYDREAEVIYPPVDCSQFYVSRKVGNYFLAGGRLVAYKRFDLTIEAFNRLGWPLLIFGRGPYEQPLRKMAKKNIKFLGHVSDKEKSQLLSECVAFLHPQLEDLGLLPLEAMASGRPVVAYGRGGALETVREGKTGKFFYEQKWETLLDAVTNFKPEEYQPEEIRAWARQFDLPEFKTRMQGYVERAYGEFQGGHTRAKLL